LQPLGHILRGGAKVGELYIVNAAGAVQRQAGDDPVLHSIEQHRIQAHFDHMRAHEHDNRFFLSPRRHDGIRQGKKIAGLELLGQMVDKI
jgi:hypothetical protein